jgi:cyclophilin family peptidyl-prolyl cis-trans isomerase
MDLVGVLLCLGLFVVGCTKASESSSEATSQPSSDAPPARAVAASAPLPRLAAGVPEENHPLVELQTSMGRIQLQLDADKAPETVHNFISYVVSGHYDGTIFHQVEKGYAIIGGGYTPDLAERRARYPIRNEAANGLKNRRGTIAMARRMDDADSATCQFVINLTDNPTLDHQGDSPQQFGFCVFGEVVDGQEVLDRIAAIPVRDTEAFSNLPVQAVVIKSAKRLR